MNRSPNLPSSSCPPLVIDRFPGNQPSPAAPNPLPQVSESPTLPDLVPAPTLVVTAPQRIPARKRLLDLVCLCLVLPAVVPMALVISLYIKWVSPGPILFRQHRVGHREKSFELLKFRSMHVHADPRAHQSHTAELLQSNRPLTKMDEHDDERLIPGGRWLRASGLDELPQLLNVWRAEMSIVGPRPCTTYEFDLLNAPQKARFHVLPGMTGLWQVSGKNLLTFNQMIDLDVRYAQRCSFLLDLGIMARTLPVLCRQINQLRQRKRAQSAKREAPSAKREAGSGKR